MHKKYGTGAMLWFIFFLVSCVIDIYVMFTGTFLQKLIMSGVYCVSTFGSFIILFHAKLKK